MRHTFIITCSLIAIFCICASANARALWSDHYSFANPTMVVATQNKTICGSSAGLFSLNSNDKALEKITKTNLLSSQGITAIASDGKSLLFVGYANGDIDIVNVDEYTKSNIPELRLTDNVEKKQINALYNNGNTLYCALNVGLLEVDLRKKEIKSHYKLRSENINVLSVAIAKDSIFAATNIGLLAANAASRTLEDPNEWRLVSDSKPFCSVVNWNGIIIAAAGAIGAECTIYSYEANGLQSRLSVPAFRCLAAKANQLLVTSSTKVEILGADFGSTRIISKYTFFKEEGENEVRNIKANAAAFGSGNEIVIAESSVGLLIVQADNSVAYYLPNGPSNNNSHAIKAIGNDIYISGGGVVQGYNGKSLPLAIHIYTNREWKNLTTSKYRDPMEITYDPANPDSIYVSMWGNGLFQIKDHALGKLYNKDNSALEDIFTGYSYQRIGAIVYDNHSNLIVSNASVAVGLKVKTPEGKWYPLSYTPTDGLHSTRRAIVTRNDNVWLIIPRNTYRGLIVFNTRNTLEDSSDDVYRSTYPVDDDPRFAGPIELKDETGETLTTFIFDIEEDQDGILWLGTDKGVVTFNGDRTVFDSPENPIFQRIKVPRNDGSNLADYLLEDVTINDIAVDGANRKWIATATDGVYLLSADGCETIHNFTLENSPLPSNEVVAVDVSPVTGEVFFGTPNGVVSFLADATVPEKELKNVRIYPNPVRPDFVDDVVKITGLVDKTQVKITDVAGRLVYQSTSLGGLATWDCTNLDGKRVDTGVYLVWTLSPDGLEAAAGKITVVR